jgi:hypothetical protein
MGEKEKSYFDTILPTVQENSKTVRNTYISYLAVAAYIWLTIESITHRHLLIPDERLALSVIGLKLPVVGFFGIAGAILLYGCKEIIPDASGLRDVVLQH